MLHVSLSGEQVITHDGTGVRVRSSRAVELVAFLVAHAGSPQALTNVRRELRRLRQVLGAKPSLVVTSRICAGVITETGTLCP